MLPSAPNKASMIYEQRHSVNSGFSRVYLGQVNNIHGSGDAFCYLALCLPRKAVISLQRDILHYNFALQAHNIMMLMDSVHKKP